jgi:hypothetical protein
MKKDELPEPEGGDSEKFPSTVTNKLLPPSMVEQSRELGLKEFTINDLDGNPEYYLKFSNGSWQEKCMIHGEWLQFQINFFQNEKRSGRYYPALGNKENWERKMKGDTLQKGDEFDMDEGVLGTSK